MYVSYDEEGGILYVQFRERRAEAASRDHGGDRYLEYDDLGPLAVEFLHASAGIDLSGIPEAEAVARALRSLSQLLAASVRLSA